MGKTIKKKDLTPEQWSTILRTIKREKELEAERKYLVELKKYEDKLRLQQKHKKAKKTQKDETDIVDEIYKLYFNGMTRKEVLKLKGEDDGSTALGLNDKINRLNTKILQHQQEVYDEKMLDHLASKDEAFYKSNEFTLWAETNLESEGIYGDTGIVYDFNFNDGEWKPGELEHLKEQYSDYMLSLVANDEETGFLQENNIWQQIDLYEYQNNPDYLTDNRGQLGIKIDGTLLPSNENIVEVIESANESVISSNLFGTRIKQLDNESFKLGLNNEALLSEEFPELHKSFKIKVDKTKQQMNNTVLPELNNNDIKIDDEFIKNEQIQNNDAKQDSIKEFKFQGQTGALDQTHKSTVKDTPSVSPAFASNKTRVDWAKVTGKKWHETA